MPNYYSYNELKRKLRKLKQLEIKIRYGDNGAYQASVKNNSNNNLVWNDFFDLNEVQKENAKYPISRVASMSKDEYKELVNEFLTLVYLRLFKEKGILYLNNYDPELLNQLGLPYDADSIAVKKRFREMVKKYHPDAGGDSEQFLELMKKFERL